MAWATVYLIAGPNGAGKTTFARTVLPKFHACVPFVNADLIAAGLSPFAPEQATFRAGRIMLSEIQAHVRNHQDFGFESTLAGRGHQALLRRIKQERYQVHIHFLWLPTPHLAVQRVARRVREGGHNVASSAVVRHYSRGIANFLKTDSALADQWWVLDN